MQVNENLIDAYLYGLLGLHEGYYELRYIPADEGSVKRKFFEAPFNNKQPINHIKKNWGEGNQLYHVFNGVNLRSSRRSKERYLKCCNCFFVDVDAKDFDNGKEEARQVIDNFPLTPTFTVDSGNGFHVYFRLSDPFSINHRGDIEEAKQVSLKLHEAFNGDSTHDLSRILRVPGSLNVKDPDNPKMCKFDSISFQTYSFNELKEVLPDKDVDISNQANLDLSTESDINELSDLEDRVPNFILNRAKDRPKKFQDDRSANDFYVAVSLFQHGLNDQEVLDSFKVFAKLDWDSGKKMKEQGGKSYIKKTVASAKSEYEKRKKLEDDLGSIRIVE